MTLTRETLARLAAAYAGVVFGIYWIPLRAAEEAGFPGIWAAGVFSAVPLVLVAPLIFWHWRAFGRARFHLGGALAGLALGAYAVSFLYTDVVRAVLLFYLTPVWGFALGWLVLGERMTLPRWVAVGLGAVGMAVIFGADHGVPLPRNAGDWLALASGLLWAVASLAMLTDARGATVPYTLAFFLYGAVAVVGTALLLPGPAPDWSALPETLAWLVPVAALVVVPGGFATIYGPSVLSPGVVGLLFMTEITVATVTAALLAGEPFGWREGVGVGLISLAGLAEPVALLTRRRR